MIADKDEHIKTILSVIPEKPGCYQYFDENGTIIYVGKAKNLKRRVSSYFNKVHDSNKTRVLVKQIRDIKYIVVDTEEDALLLENNLIKQYRIIEGRQNLPFHRGKERVLSPGFPNPEHRSGRITILRSLSLFVHGESDATNAKGTLPFTHL